VLAVHNFTQPQAQSSVEVRRREPCGIGPERTALELLDRIVNVYGTFGHQ
jgi:hypothetical protein